jgi:HD-like signal output (HDOD) protein
LIILDQDFAGNNSLDILSNTVNKNHAKLGASLLKLWKFSGEYLRVTTYHDNLKAADEKSKELLVVHFSNHLVKAMGLGEDEGSDVDLTTIESASELGLDGEMIESVKDNVKVMMDEISGLLK